MNADIADLTLIFFDFFQILHIFFNQTKLKTTWNHYTKNYHNELLDAFLQFTTS